MQNKKFIELRKSKKISQAKLAESLFLPISSIRKWEKGESIPSLDDMKKLAFLLDETEKQIFEIFKPRKTKIETDLKEEDRIYKNLLKLFFDTYDTEKLLLISTIFCKAKCIGVAIYENYTFPFYEIISDVYKGTLILIGEDKNSIIFTISNVANIVPVSADYNVYTFQIQVRCPIFLIKEKYNPDVFRQTIRVSFYTNLLAR